jgi:hypothetical protein
MAVLEFLMLLRSASRKELIIGHSALSMTGE